ncbi:hypothetical protein ACLEPN_29690 [Myxococcus sp. 1LA]
MARQEQIIQRLARQYRREHGVDSVDPEKFADYLIKHGVTPPKVPSARELMARVARRALKHEVRRDKVSGQPYRGWHPVPAGKNSDGQMIFAYFDIDDAPRHAMEKAVALRINSMVNDGVQVARDAAHWNRINPEEQPLAVQELLDLRDPVEWRMNADDDQSDDDGEQPEPPAN